MKLLTLILTQKNWYSGNLSIYLFIDTKISINIERKAMNKKNFDEWNIDFFFNELLFCFQEKNAYL